MTSNRGDTFGLGNDRTGIENKPVTVSVYSKEYKSDFRVLSVEEVSGLIDSGKHYVYYAIRNFPINLFSDNDIRKIFGLATGFKLKKLVRLIDSEDFQKDVLEYPPADHIMWNEPSIAVLGKLDPVPVPGYANFFRRTSEIADGRIVYREVIDAEDAPRSLMK